MNKKIIMAVVAIGIIALIIIVALNNKNSAPEAGVAGNNGQNSVIDSAAPAATGNNKEQAVKEFTMTSFYDDTGIWFSLKEISVNKGEIVRIKVTNIKGTHDFTLDEYGIKKMTPLNEEVVIEFTADKAGEFIYYCSVSGHRQKGQWGTLKVLDK